MPLTADQINRVDSLRARIEKYEALSLALAGMPHNQVRKELISYGFQNATEVERMIATLYSQLDSLTGGNTVRTFGIAFI